jgi:DNA-binding HxlR family transcriptional regulator
MAPYGQFCALARALDHIGRRWALLIVRELLISPKRFTDLRSGLPGIPPNLLAARLRELQESGLVEKRDLPPPLDSTVYQLTPRGRELRPMIRELVRWGGPWMTDGMGDDVFLAEWLVVALDGLGCGHRLPTPVVIAVGAKENEVMLSLGEGGVSLADPGAIPSVTVRGDPRLILGIASGQLRVRESLVELRVTPRDRKAVGLLERALSPA